MGIVLTSERLQVLGFELTNNTFTHTKDTANVVHGLSRDTLALNDLLESDPLDWEPVFRSKPDGGNRPGFHGTLPLIASRTALFAGLLDAYMGYASTYDYAPCFWRVLENTNDFSQMIVPSYQARQRRAIAIDMLAANHGEYVCCLDLRHFYRDIAPHQVLRILGPSGLQLDPLLVDDICIDVDIHNGLIQSSLISDMISRLLLVPFDRHVVDQELPVVRFQDDIYAFAATFEEAEALSQELEQVLEGQMLGFAVNRAKLEVEVNRTRWVRRGVVWGELPIELYECSDRHEAHEKVELIGGSTTAAREGARGSARELIDWPAVFQHHHGPDGDCINPYMRNLTLENLGRIRPQLVTDNVSKIVQRYPSTIRSILKGLEAGKDKASQDSFACIRERSSIEDDRLGCFSGTSVSNRVDLFQKMLRQDGIVSRAVRQGVIVQLPRAQSIWPSVEVGISSSAWLDEYVAAIRYAVDIDSKEAKAWLRATIDKKPVLGPIVELMSEG